MGRSEQRGGERTRVRVGVPGVGDTTQVNPVLGKPLRRGAAETTRPMAVVKGSGVGGPWRQKMRVRLGELTRGDQPGSWVGQWRQTSCTMKQNLAEQVAGSGKRKRTPLSKKTVARARQEEEGAAAG